MAGVRYLARRGGQVRHGDSDRVMAYSCSSSGEPGWSAQLSGRDSFKEPWG